MGVNNTNQTRRQLVLVSSSLRAFTTPTEVSNCLLPTVVQLHPCNANPLEQAPFVEDRISVGIIDETDMTSAEFRGHDGILWRQKIIAVNSNYLKQQSDRYLHVKGAFCEPATKRRTQFKGGRSTCGLQKPDDEVGHHRVERSFGSGQHRVGRWWHGTGMAVCSEGISPDFSTDVNLGSEDRWSGGWQGAA